MRQLTRDFSSLVMKTFLSLPLISFSGKQVAVRVFILDAASISFRGRFRPSVHRSVRSSIRPSVTPFSRADPGNRIVCRISDLDASFFSVLFVFLYTVSASYVVQFVLLPISFLSSSALVVNGAPTI